MSNYHTTIRSLYRSESPLHGTSSGCGWRRRPPDTEGSCKAVADSRKRVVLQLGRFLWNNLGKGKWIWDSEHGMLGVSMGQVQWKQLQADWLSINYI